MTASVHKARLLVVDDEVELMTALCEALRDEGFEASGCSDASAGLQALRQSNFDILLSDLMMPGLDGIQLLKQAKQIDPALVGIIMTGQGTIQTAVEAMKVGAFDYILKPFRLQQVLPILNRGLEVGRLRKENARLRQFVQQLVFESPRYQIIGASTAIRKVLHLIEKVAGTEATVLVRGESGTGKELVARAIHNNSQRRDKPLVTINCATLQENLLESELFGHDRGAFTGADKPKVGLFEIAEGGTLFIDEIAEMTPSLQAKLLRVLEDGHYRRVGSTLERWADVRVIAATNKPLEAEQKAGRFREDLYFRLNVLTIPLPPLRERREDIPLIVEHLLRTRPLGRSTYSVEPSAMQALTEHNWPGNVRELANVLERAQILAEGLIITTDDLPENLLKPTASAEAHPPFSPDNLDERERVHVREVMRKFEGNKLQAAKALGISRRSLYRLIDKHHLSHVAELPDLSPPDSLLED